MAHVVMHRLMDGRWRVTDAPDGWVDDGREYPEPTASDRVFEHEADAVRDYLARASPRDPEDDIPDGVPTNPEAPDDD